jgi:predicted short-subunit dehydrogenase-like oxidoreductase (DUF2520 family)
MAKKQKQTVVILGCGQVAWHLASHLHSLRRFNLHLYNHRPSEHLYTFSSQLDCTVYDSFDHIRKDADVYVFCVSDKALAAAAARVECHNPRALLIHTSGSMPRNTLGQRLQATAVMYPLQSFSRQIPLRWSEVPLLLEYKGREAGTALKSFATLFSPVQQQVNEEERLRLHLCAVLVNNFTNALYTSAHSLLPDHSHFELLWPLMQQTLTKLRHLSPLEAQTGPARRGDREVQKKHLALLKDHKEIKKVYKQLSKLIVYQHKQEDAEF